MPPCQECRRAEQACPARPSSRLASRCSSE